VDVVFVVTSSVGGVILGADDAGGA
jgi:hypothetical protein